MAIRHMRRALPNAYNVRIYGDKIAYFVHVYTFLRHASVRTYVR